jgi:5-oxopent-3-ene-1,2,5-tricarboxylate decarboxylase / 2-hydroxyhepta-2,4-diene-1,7-dioate isomerase
MSGTPAYRCAGTVYGTLLNHRPALVALGDAVNQAPYKAPPKAPVLYIKPRNTFAGQGAKIEVPSEATELEVGASLGLVFARTACRVDPALALSFLEGYIIVADISVPHAVFYRPSVRFKARDGFCPMGPRIVPRASIPNPDALAVRVSVDGSCVHRTSTADMLRPAARLIAEVSEFMTLRAGDVLLLGVAHGAPRARAGQSAAIEIDGLGRLEMSFVAAVENLR